MSPFLSQAVFWLAASSCLIAQVALIWSAVRSPMPGSVDNPVTLPRRSSEIAWTIVPAIGLVLLLGATWRAMHRPVPTHDMPNMSDTHQMIDE